MHNNIESVLGQDYLMFYHPGLPVSKFTPVQGLEQCVEISNHLLGLYGRQFDQWDPRHHDTIARIMNANWICNRLSVEPIRKPIVVHQQDHKFIVDCGDTRIIALSSLPNPPLLSAVITVRKSQAKEFSDWQAVTTNQDLVSLCGFDAETTTILFTPEADQDWCISWLEIGDRSTSHHLHSVPDRVAMLQRYLNTQPKNFCFSKDWICEPIDWTKYQAN
jgi:hypothetical protein